MTEHRFWEQNDESPAPAAPGDWTIDMERFGPQLAIMMQGILKLHARNDAHAKRIGRYLVYQFRVRAAEQS